MNWPLSVIGSDPPKSSSHLELSQAFFDSPRINAIYVHIPFCFHKCHYCDFYSIVDSPGPNNRQPQFLDTLILELNRRSSQLRLRPHTLFAGGGTPTYLAPPLWTRFLSSLHEHHILDEVSEFTVEANPETVTSALLDQLVKGGVNRISMGAQSFQPDLLKTLERWHDPASVAHACNLARQAGIRNLNLDLIFAIPGQTMAQLDADLDALLTLEPQHLSCYGLTYEPGTALLEKLQLGRVHRLDEDLEKVMFEHVITRLTRAGYEQYEISNFALPGQQCQHNLHYWANDNWLGLGPAAASHVNGYRWKNAPHLGKYLASNGESPIIDIEHLPPERRLGETLMLGLRLRQGIARNWLQENLPVNDPRQAAIDEMIQMGMLETTTSHLRLTHRGLLVADSVIARLL